MSYANKLLEYATEYHAALSSVAKARNVINPVGYLAAHAIELAFKSYLSSIGYDPSALKRIGHDVVKLWEDCLEGGLALPVDIPIGFAVLAQNNGTANKFPYRFPPEEGGIATAVPDVDQVSDAVLEIISIVEQAVAQAASK